MADDAANRDAARRLALKRRRQRSLALLAALLTFSVLFYAISIVRMGDRVAERRSFVPQ